MSGALFSIPFVMTSCGWTESISCETWMRSDVPFRAIWHTYLNVQNESDHLHKFSTSTFCRMSFPHYENLGPPHDIWHTLTSRFELLSITDDYVRHLSLSWDWITHDHEGTGLPIIFAFPSVTNYLYLGHAKSCVKIWTTFYFGRQCTLLDQSIRF